MQGNNNFGKICTHEREAMTVKESDKVADAVKTLKEFCKACKVEININAVAHVAIWAELDKSDITIDGIAPGEIPNATQILGLMRKCGWKSV